MTRVPDRPKPDSPAVPMSERQSRSPATATRERIRTGRSGREPKPGNRDARNRQLYGQPARGKAAAEQILCVPLRSESVSTRRVNIRQAGRT
jgi:hypothetical protein